MVKNSRKIVTTILKMNIQWYMNAKYVGRRTVARKLVSVIQVISNHSICVDASPQTKIKQNLFKFIYNKDLRNASLVEFNLLNTTNIAWDVVRQIKNQDYVNCAISCVTVALWSAASATKDSISNASDFLSNIIFLFTSNYANATTVKNT